MLQGAGRLRQKRVLTREWVKEELRGSGRQDGLEDRAVGVMRERRGRERWLGG